MVTWLSMNAPYEVLIDRLLTLVGVASSYLDTLSQPNEVSLEHRMMILSALHFDLSSAHALQTAIAALEQKPWRRWIAPVVIRTGGAAGTNLDLFLPSDEMSHAWTWQVACEDGARHEGTFHPNDLPIQGVREIDGRRIEWRRLRLSALLPIGYHHLTLGRAFQIDAQLVIAPPRCYIPAELHTPGGRRWGLSGQLYTLRSERNWGIGDFSDLDGLCTLAGRSGASLVLTNPLHALFPHRPADASPYAPSSRLHLNPIYIDITAAPGFPQCSAAQVQETSLAALRKTTLVDYPRVWSEKMRALEALFVASEGAFVGDAGGTDGDREFADFVAQGGPLLERFAAFCVLDELHCNPNGEPTSWRQWPTAYRTPHTTAVAHIHAERSHRIRFYQYVQYLADRQLRVAAESGRQVGLSFGLVRDLALGIDPDGADAWSQQGAFAADLRCGAPPDAFNPHGQEWGVLPLNPTALQHDYSPFIAALRANMRHAGGLRIDHIAGLQRQWLVPLGERPSHGCYVRYPFDDLLSILALESYRHRCMVIVEDLGTVPEALHDRVRAAGAFGYGILYFERGSDGSFKPPASYREQVIVSAATHDLPTVVGYWTGRDIEMRQKAGIYADAEAYNASEQRRADRAQLMRALTLAGVDVSPIVDEAPQALQALVEAVHEFLASSSARLFIAQLDDLLGEPDQVNIPGTPSQCSNWRRKLPVKLENTGFHEALEVLATICARYGRAP